MYWIHCTEYTFASLTVHGSVKITITPSEFTAPVDRRITPRGVELRRLIKPTPLHIAFGVIMYKYYMSYNNKYIKNIHF